jgi:hypothetical protein
MDDFITIDCETEFIGTSVIFQFPGSGRTIYLAEIKIYSPITTQPPTTSPTFEPTYEPTTDPDDLSKMFFFFFWNIRSIPFPFFWSHILHIFRHIAILVVIAGIWAI